MDVKDRIQQYIDYKGIAAFPFEKSIGCSNGYWRKTKSISANILTDIARVYSDLSIEWAVTGQGSMLKSEASAQPTQASSSVIMIPFEEYKKSIAEKDEVIKDQAHKIGMLEHELQLFTSKKQTALGMENASTAAEHQMSIPEAE